ncbi:MAG: transcriptional regulator NrdR [Candidatus Moranbacteria bacterium CG10_big_fil_rev_8_21_14_0_10_35_21]|nr:MAG: transcriptional regulator NrdR [Candidatus Moranbacteria bacterium CG10_big_fil_rev_8_21_14_0_10_35_21]PJA88671.1 MAG: transcriptional regulator NrdR [Candidatus Moranbacteria bacterium CG_4_9_14_3_um_filter_36_9]
MNCPFCNYTNTLVIDSRETGYGKITRRRRECEKCQVRFSTYEEVELLRLSVVKKNGEKEDYDKNKIETGVRRALIKRPVSQDKIANLLGDIEYTIRALEKPEVTTREIGRIVLKKLSDLDEVAYVRFASVYKSFSSVESFKKELDSLDNPGFAFEIEH